MPDSVSDALPGPNHEPDRNPRVPVSLPGGPLSLPPNRPRATTDRPTDTNHGTNGPRTTNHTDRPRTTDHGPTDHGRTDRPRTDRPRTGPDGNGMRARASDHGTRTDGATLRPDLIGRLGPARDRGPDRVGWTAAVLNGGGFDRVAGDLDHLSPHPGGRESVTNWCYFSYSLWVLACVCGVFGLVAVPTCATCGRVWVGWRLPCDERGVW